MELEEEEMKQYKNELGKNGVTGRRENEYYGTKEEKVGGEKRSLPICMQGVRE